MLSLVVRRCVERVLHLVTQGEAELMVASHNQVSVDKATQLMHTLGLDPSTSGVIPASCHVDPHFCST